MNLDELGMKDWATHTVHGGRKKCIPSLFPSSLVLYCNPRDGYIQFRSRTTEWTMSNLLLEEDKKTPFSGNVLA